MEGRELCRRIRVNEVTSLIVGDQTVPYVCGGIVSVDLERPNGDVEGYCWDCAGEIAAEDDAALLRQWGDTVAGWAGRMQGRADLPGRAAVCIQIANWLITFAAEFENCARLAEGKTE